MFRFSFCCLAVLFLAAFLEASDVYPSSYPFENESNPPESPLPSTPNYSYDLNGVADPGGYGYTFMYTYIIQKEELPFSIWDGGTVNGNRGGVFAYYARKERGWPFPVSSSTFNCTVTSEGKRFHKDTWAGGFGDVFYCKVGECCKEYVGLPSRTGVDQADKADAHSAQKTMYEGGLCDPTKPMCEDAYCASNSGLFTSWCYEQYVTVTERLITTPCYDQNYNFVFSCPLFRATGAYSEIYEPKEYYEKSTIAQNQANAGMTSTMADKICRPYSYYNPETAKDYNKKKSSTSNTSDTSTSTFNTFFTITFICLMSFRL